MDITSTITAVISSLGISIGGVWAFGKMWFSHHLSMDKSVFEGEVKKQVDEYLGNKSAQRDYEFEAKKRLYQAIGPLRFQLLLATRDAANHIKNYAKRPFDLDNEGYYFQSTVYRIVRPIALVELIERQIAIADFAIEPAAIDILRFKSAAYNAFGGGQAIFEHPEAIWGSQNEHIFTHSLNRIAHAVIIEEEDKKARICRFEEFQALLGSQSESEKLSPLLGQLREFDQNKKPIFWLRLVCFGYLCSSLLNSQGSNLGFSKISYPHLKLIAHTNDKFAQNNQSNIEKAHNEIFDQGL